MIKIWVTDQFVGYHRWAECPFEEVKYLRDWHRHLFKVKVTFHVTHDDRDLEFFMVKRDLSEILRDCFEEKYLNKSCEMYAREIYENLVEDYPVKYSGKILEVEVSEDGENGAIFIPPNTDGTVPVLSDPLGPNSKY